MDKKLSFYKEMFKDLVSKLKKDEIDKIIKELETFEDDIPKTTIKKIETFTKPYPLPLYYFGLLIIIKIVLDLKKELFMNYKYYYDTYNDFRKKEFKTEEEDKIFTEVGEILYRMDEIDSKFKKNVSTFIQQINLKINKNKQDESIFLSKITPESYTEIYPIYEELMDILLNIINEIKIEKDFYKIVKTYKESK